MADSTSTFTITDGVNTITLERPWFGYTASIMLALEISRKTNGKFAIWDNSSSYDIYKYSGKIFLTIADQAELEQMIKDTDQGRASELTIHLAALSGFFPFGPTRGDGGAGAAGDFDVFVTAFNPIGIIDHPTDYFENDIEFVAQTFPAYAIPADAGTGSLAIGNAAGAAQVSNIRFPQDYSQQDFQLNQVPVITRDGTSKTIDLGETGDSYNTSLPLTLQHPKASNLLDYIIGTTRGGDFSIISPANSYIFGRDKGSTDTYKVNLINPVIDVQHSEFNIFDFTLSVNLVEVL